MEKDTFAPGSLGNEYSLPPGSLLHFLTSQCLVHLWTVGHFTGDPGFSCYPNTRHIVRVLHHVLPKPIRWTLSFNCKLPRVNQGNGKMYFQLRCHCLVTKKIQDDHVLWQGLISENGGDYLFTAVYRAPAPCYDCGESWMLSSSQLKPHRLDHRLVQISNTDGCVSKQE